MGYVPGERGVDPGTEIFLSGEKPMQKLPCNYRIPLLHIGVIPPLCGIESCHIQGGFFMPYYSALSIFTPEYWRTASSEFHNVRSLIFAGLTIAMGIVLGAMYIPVSINLRISVAFIVLMFGSMIFGPAVGLAAGLAYDLVGFLLFPANVFFPGYTLSTMLEFFLYGIFLYRCRITVLRVFFAKLTVDFGIHVGLGALWSKILFHKAYYYFFLKSLVKNIVMLPIEVVLFLVLLQIFLPVLAHQGITSKPKSKFIPLF